MDLLIVFSFIDWPLADKYMNENAMRTSFEEA